MKNTTELLLEEIKRDSENIFNSTEIELMSDEMTDILYDTSFCNTQFPQFNKENLTPIDENGNCHEVDRKENVIRFGYCGHIFKITVEAES